MVRYLKETKIEESDRAYDFSRKSKRRFFATISAFVDSKFFNNDETKEELLAYCRKHIAKYAIPKDIEFRDELPKTLVGKVAYRVLEEEEEEKRKNM